MFYRAPALSYITIVPISWLDSFSICRTTGPRHIADQQSLALYKEKIDKKVISLWSLEDLTVSMVERNHFLDTKSDFLASR